MKNPIVINNLLSQEEFKELQDYVKNLDKSTLGPTKYLLLFEII